MPTIDIAHFKILLKNQQNEFMDLSNASSKTRKPATLDQQSVGRRLLRQDVLQQQAMAKAQDARRHTQRQRIALALKRNAVMRF